MAVDKIDPPELSQVLDAAERPRASGWSLRAALTRYAQPQPQRASEVIELLRRLEFALKPHLKQLEKEGPAVWGTVASGGDGLVADLLRALAEIDRLGDAVASWAVARAGERPDGLVDTVVADVAARLQALGVPREERPRPSGARA
jgi:hypothetical protein